MKLIIVALICFVFRQTSTQFLGQNNCPHIKPGQYKAPTGGKYYQVLRFKLSNLTEVPQCRNIKLILNADKSVTFNQSLVGPFNVVLNQTFVAKTNGSRYWNVTENAKPSSSIFLDVISAGLATVFTCMQEAIMPLAQGVYSQNKTLSSSEMTSVINRLSKLNITQYEKVDQTKCKN